MMIVRPVVIEPLLREWEQVKAGIEKARTSEKRKRELLGGFLERLKRFRVLDPACGSGNFLYLALLALKDLEHRVNLEAEALGLGKQLPTVGPEAVLGIELNPFAAELARVTVWIGEIQWMRKNGYGVSENPILKPLDNIENRDALLNADGTEAVWPKADVAIGNPPFLGNKKMMAELGESYVETLRSRYAGRVSGGVDLVTYWFDKAWQSIAIERLHAAGFVATNSIRGGANRAVIAPIADRSCIFEAWDDEEWTVDGAAVRVSLLCFRRDPSPTNKLNGLPVARIFSDLTASASGTDITSAKRLEANRGLSFQGPVKVGAFDVPGDLARQWLKLPLNPNGRPNSDVLFPWANGMDVVRRPADKWIIDFGEMTENEASLYEAPFEYVVQHVKPERLANRDTQRREKWWRLGRSGGDLKEATKTVTRQIITPRVAKHRLFVWRSRHLMPDSAVVSISRDDDFTFGILHSRVHEVWSLRLGTYLGVGNDPRYTPSSTFETFPFPEGMSPDAPASVAMKSPHAIQVATKAADLDRLRENWLNPPGLVKTVAEVVPGYPDRVTAVDAAAATELKKRTLTNLYNARPAWLANAHKALDEAVFAAYGWPTSLTDDDILNRLLKLNQERSSEKGGKA
jgi:type II restriction/modification system DNA methylase subunit YeeA